MYCLMDHQWGNDYPELRGIFASFDKALNEINENTDLRCCTIEFRKTDIVASGEKIELRPIGWILIDESGIIVEQECLDEVTIVAKYGGYHRIDDSGYIIYRDNTKNSAFVAMFQPVKFISLANNIKDLSFGE